jgi:hypothetical protein
MIKYDMHEGWSRRLLRAQILFTLEEKEIMDDVNKPQDQGELGQPGIGKMNTEEAFLDLHPQIAFDSIAYCSSDERR